MTNTKNNRATACILAAGKGTRMQSNLAKVLHILDGKALIHYPIEALKRAQIEPIVLVIGHQKEALITETQNITQLDYAIQNQQLGTGHALLQAKNNLLAYSQRAGLRDVVVLPGDCPLISEKSITHLLDLHQKKQAAASLLTAKLNDPASYGRILRNTSGDVIGIKEAKDCTKEDYQIKEINSGIYCFNSDLLFNELDNLSTNNAQGEYYLTDVIASLHQKKHRICGCILEDSKEILGVNSKEDLSLVKRYL